MSGNHESTAGDKTKSYGGFTDEERAAMKERAQELKSSKSGARGAEADPEAAVLEKITEMPERDRAIAERLHAIITESAPELTPQTWYGMPAYSKGGKVLCFFQPADKFKSRYASFGFEESAHLDDGTMWPTAFAIAELTAENEETIRALVTKAIGCRRTSSSPTAREPRHRKASWGGDELRPPRPNAGV